jgi:hypothetical protein
LSIQFFELIRDRPFYLLRSAETLILCKDRELIFYKRAKEGSIKGQRFLQPCSLCAILSLPLSLSLSLSLLYVGILKPWNKFFYFFNMNR